MLISIQNFYSNSIPRAHQGLHGSLCCPGYNGWTLQNITESVGKGSYVVIREESVDSILDDFCRIAILAIHGEQEQQGKKKQQQWNQFLLHKPGSPFYDNKYRKRFQ